MSHRNRSFNGNDSPGFNSKSLLLLAAICLVFFFIVLPAQAGELPNKYCPVTTSELAEEQFFVDYQDQRIYFCCNKCKKDFLSDPDLYLANLVSAEAESSPAAASSHDHSNGGHGHGEDVEKLAPERNEVDSNIAHDHQTDHGESSSLIRFTGKFHPMLTHFPIALTLAALLFSTLAGVLKNQTMDFVSVYCIYLAALTGIGTVIIGLAAGYAASYPSFLSDYLSWHRWLGITTGIITILTALAGRRLLQQSSKGTVWSYRVSLLVNAILVGVTGHFGAMLVFGPDHFNF